MTKPFALSILKIEISERLLSTFEPPGPSNQTVAIDSGRPENWHLQ
jgi:hypothetical protein